MKQKASKTNSLLNIDVSAGIEKSHETEIQDLQRNFIKMQKELANRYKQIDEIKTELAQHIISLTDITIN